MEKVRVLAKYVKVHNRRLNRAVRYVRGDVFAVEDLEPAAMQQLFETYGPRDGRGQLRKLIAEHGAAWRARDTSGKMDWREPAWFQSGMIPAVDFVAGAAAVTQPAGDPERDAKQARIDQLERELAAARAEIEFESHNQLPPRDGHGRFVKE